MLPASNLPERLIFVCPSCGLTLSADSQQAGVSGPCPSCGAQVSAPGQSQSMVSCSPDMPKPDTAQVRAVTTSSNHRKGGIVADSALDHQHSDRRETAKSLWIIALFVLVIGACLLVTWFLKNWISK